MIFNNFRQKSIVIGLKLRYDKTKQPINSRCIMADKITVAEAVSLANQDTKDLTNEQLTQMNEPFAEIFFNREQFSDEAKMANIVTLPEINSRL